MRGAQLPLEFSEAPSFARDDFLVSKSNEKAWRFFESWPDWPDRSVALIGPGGTGKSHLVTIWADRARAIILNAQDVGDEAAQRVIEAGAAVIEDLDRSPGRETELFHFLNRARAENVSLVVTARTQPDFWGVTTRDLVSRLRLSPVVEIDEPDDALMRAVLVKLLVDRQLAVDASTLGFIALRLDRSLDAARRFVKELDREALARSRPVTRRLASDVLAHIAGGHGESHPAC